MTAVTISRRQRSAPPAAKRRSAAPAAPSRIARTIAALPVDHDKVQRGVTRAIVAAFAAALLAVAVLLGVPAWIGDQIATVSARAGLAVRHIEIVGLKNMDRMTVYAVALDQQSQAMTRLDLDRVRDELLQHGWIADARVSRRLPDTLVVDIVERVPAAVWQHERALSLIDANGIVLAPVAIDAMPDLPLLIGPDANVQATALTDLMAKAPRLNALLSGASWVGNRRWDLRFQSGETLMLPEGEAAAAKALALFERLDAEQRLLARGHLRFDMRDATQMRIKLGPPADRPRIDQPDGTPAAAPAPATVAPVAPTPGGGVV